MFKSKSPDIESRGTTNNNNSSPPPQHNGNMNTNDRFDDDILSGDVYEEDATPINDFSNNNDFDKNFGANNSEGHSPAITLSDPFAETQACVGAQVRLHAKLLRKREHGAKVTNIELFFDLVFVYAISSISESMVEDLTWEVVLEMLVITLAVWWAWVFSAWTFNWFNPDSYLVRLSLMALMLVNLIMSAVISGSYTNQSLLFAGMYVLIQLGRSLLAVLALHGHRLQMNYIRISAWFFVSGILWMVGGAIGGTTRNVLWTIAIVFEYLSPAAGFHVPFLGRSTTADWDIHGGHLAERCSLFIIIALGESIVVTGEAFKEVIHEPAGVGMFIVSFLGACAMWWIYFHTASTEAIEYVEHSSDPGKMGRLGYTYIHVIMVVGIIWSAVADRISIEHPYLVPHHEEHEKIIYAAIMIGGPGLFVLGHAMFRRTFCTKWSYPHLVTVAVLICVTPIAIYLPLWATALTTTIILTILGFWESYFRCVVLPELETVVS
ncbi:hypothetical protein BGZ83_009650 [Gryganskiella cystojenkinii]|nr:hypothetical protein BGZ83_009650 [Gryganskiella cystojenkinii]